MCWAAPTWWCGWNPPLSSSTCVRVLDRRLLIVLLRSIWQPESSTAPECTTRPSKMLWIFFFPPGVGNLSDFRLGNAEGIKPVEHCILLRHLQVASYLSGFLSQSVFCTAALSWQPRLSPGAKVTVDYRLEKYYRESNNPLILSLEDLNESSVACW